MSVEERDIEIKVRPEGRTFAVRLFYRGEHVSGLWIHDLTVHFGRGVRLRMGGIGGVGTKEEYRMRGFARRVMEFSNRWMLENGFDIAALFGIRDFYERWGYAPALPEFWLAVDVRYLPDEPKLKVVPYSDEHREAVVELYERNNEGRMCSVVRAVEFWRGFSKGTSFRVEADPVVLLDGEGKVRGYISFDATGERTNVAEVGYSDGSVFESMAAAMRRRAEGRGHGEVWLAIPPDHPFAIYLRRFGCRASATFNRSGGGMMRIINLKTTFDRMAPELERRLKRSGMWGWEGEFYVKTDIGTLRLRVSRGRVKAEPTDKAGDERLELPQSKLTQLLVGYRTVEDLSLDDDVFVSPGLIPLLSALFPPLNPYIWWSDRF